jgi:hypothetical protein
MFGTDKAVAMASDLFGKPDDACSDLYQAAWAIDSKQTLVIHDMYRGFSAVLYNTALRKLGCEIE